ncbi:unnamed protein product [Closterium sp. NIES-54]
MFTHTPPRPLSLRASSCGRRHATRQTSPPSALHHSPSPLPPFPPPLPPSPVFPDTPPSFCPSPGTLRSPLLCSSPPSSPLSSPFSASFSASSAICSFLAVPPSASALPLDFSRGGDDSAAPFVLSDDTWPLEARRRGSFSEKRGKISYQGKLGEAQEMGRSDPALLRLSCGIVGWHRYDAKDVTWKCFASRVWQGVFDIGTMRSVNFILDCL